MKRKIQKKKNKTKQKKKQIGNTVDRFCLIVQ